MRGRGISIPTNFIGNHAPTKSSSSFFSTSSGSGGGGRGRIFNPGQFSSTNADEEKQPEKKPEGTPGGGSGGLGHGRGKPLASGQVFPEFASFISSLKQTTVAPGGGIGRGRGGGEAPRPEKPAAIGRGSAVPARESYLPSSLRSTLQSFGRGKSDAPVVTQGVPEKEVNRHVRSARAMPRADGGGGGGDDGGAGEQIQRRPRFGQEEAARGGGAEGSEGRRRGDGGMEMGRGGRGGMGRGRGRGMGRGRGRGRERGDFGGGRGRRRDGMTASADDSDGEDFHPGNNADGEKLAERVGVEFMNELVDGFEEMSGRVLPSPLEDEFLDALDTNFKIEFEEEYLMGEFDLNPDIDEKPPMPLRDMLEKVKPFLMCYEGIQSHEEWEEVVEETMKNVPLLKKIVDHYSGPDRVTAKQQQQELERVAETIPAAAPPSVKRFADRAVLSLQSNPGWGFDKKCQFMDKLVMEVSKQYR